MQKEGHGNRQNEIKLIGHSLEIPGSLKSPFQNKKNPAYECKQESLPLQ